MQFAKILNSTRVFLLGTLSKVAESQTKYSTHGRLNKALISLTSAVVICFGFFFAEASQQDAQPTGTKTVNEVRSKVTLKVEAKDLRTATKASLVFIIDGSSSMSDLQDFLYNTVFSESSSLVRLLKQFQGLRISTISMDEKRFITSGPITSFMDSGDLNSIDFKRNNPFSVGTMDSATERPFDSLALFLEKNRSMFDSETPLFLIFVTDAYDQSELNWHYAQISHQIFTTLTDLELKRTSYPAEVFAFIFRGPNTDSHSEVNELKVDQLVGLATGPNGRIVEFQKDYSSKAKKDVELTYLEIYESFVKSLEERIQARTPANKYDTVNLYLEPLFGISFFDVKDLKISANGTVLKPAHYYFDPVRKVITFWRKFAVNQFQNGLTLEFTFLQSKPASPAEPAATTPP